MNCIKCYQEIPDGSKFCPYCGAAQAAVPETGGPDTQAEPAVQPDTVQPEVNTQAGAMTDTAAQMETNRQPEPRTQDNAYGQPETNMQHQDAQNYNTGYQGTSGYGSGYQNDAQQNNYQNGYQNNYQNGYQYNYQNGNYPSSQQNQGASVNGTPYLVMSIVLAVISTVCCCLFAIPFAIVAIVYSAKINSAAAAGDIEAAKKAEKMAKIWLIVTVAVAVVSLIISVVVASAIGESAYYYYY